jgi:hypothetical protein
MNPITIEEFNAIPEFVHNGRVCVEIDGKIYSKQGIFNLLNMAGLLLLK